MIYCRPTPTLNQKPISNGDIPQREDTEYPSSGFGNLPNKRSLFPSGMYTRDNKYITSICYACLFSSIRKDVGTLLMLYRYKEKDSRNSRKSEAFHQCIFILSKSNFLVILVIYFVFMCNFFILVYVFDGKNLIGLHIVDFTSIFYLYYRQRIS